MGSNQNRKARNKRTVQKPKKWSENLPDTNQWQPRDSAENKIRESFLTRCVQIRERIIQRSNHEIATNIDNYDSGISIEEIVRDELSKLCPRRYTITAGVLDDRNGCTAGDVDVIIADDFWMPLLKVGATERSRRVHVPIEAVYGVIEVKQSLDYQILDEAMEKLVKCHRLFRPQIPADRIAENLSLKIEMGEPQKEFIAVIPERQTPPLFSAILAINLKPGISMDDLMSRFIKLNKQLQRQEVVQVLTILNQGTMVWVWASDPKVATLSLFREEDQYKPLYPGCYFIKNGREPFYFFAISLLRNLYLTTLSASDMPMAYGPINNQMEILLKEDLFLAPSIPLE